MLKIISRDINVVITNSKTNKTKREKMEKDLKNELNNLEAPNNSIRAIFTVKRLTEGWDVQNLYDIVRMDTTQNVVAQDQLLLQPLKKNN